MTPLLQNVAEAAVDCHYKWQRFFIFTHVWVICFTVAIGLAAKYYGRTLLLRLLCIGCVVILTRLLHERKLKHRENVLLDLSRKRMGVVVKQCDDRAVVLEYRGEYFRFKKVGDTKSAYEFDFQNGTYKEGYSIGWQEHGNAGVKVQQWLKEKENAYSGER